MHIPFEKLLWVVGEQVLNIDLALINAKCSAFLSLCHTHTHTTCAGIRHTRWHQDHFGCSMLSDRSFHLHCLYKNFLVCFFAVNKELVWVLTVALERFWQIQNLPLVRAENGSPSVLCPHLPQHHRQSTCNVNRQSALLSHLSVYC